MKAFLLLLVAVVFPAFAGMPEDFKPIKVVPAIESGRKVFDLTSAIKTAKEEKKQLFIYLSSGDCTYCRSYEGFLVREKENMRSVFATYVLVSLEVDISKERPGVRIDGKTYALKEFADKVGDQNRQFFYPYFWALTVSDLRQIRQMPIGAMNYTSVEKHAKLLQIDKDVLAAK